jgi:hypothetical protein
MVDILPFVFTRSRNVLDRLNIHVDKEAILINGDWIT